MVQVPADGFRWDDLLLETLLTERSFLCQLLEFLFQLIEFLYQLVVFLCLLVAFL